MTRGDRGDWGNIGEKARCGACNDARHLRGGGESAEERRGERRGSI